MTQQKLDKLLAGQCSSTEMSFKAHTSEKCKPVKFDEYKLMDSQDN